MFGSLGFPEILLILVLALLLFGPKRLPEIGRTIGKGMAEFRRASNELRRTLDAEVAAIDASEAKPRPIPPSSASPSPAPRPVATETSIARGEVERAPVEEAPEAAPPDSPSESTPG